MLESAFFIVERTKGSMNLQDVQRELDILHGVQSVSVNERNRLVAVGYDNSGVSYDKIENHLNKMGYQIAADASTINVQ